MRVINLPGKGRDLSPRSRSVRSSGGRRIHHTPGRRPLLGAHGAAPGSRSLALTCISAGPVVYEPLWQALEKSSCTTLSSSRRGRRRGRRPLQSACRCARREPQEGRPSVSGRHRVHWEGCRGRSRGPEPPGGSEQVAAGAAVGSHRSEFFSLTTSK